MELGQIIENIAEVDARLADIDKQVTTLNDEREEMRRKRAELRSARAKLEGGDQGSIRRYLDRQRIQRQESQEHAAKVREVLASHGLKAEDVEAATKAPDPIDRPRRKRGMK